MQTPTILSFAGFVLRIYLAIWFVRNCNSEYVVDLYGVIIAIFCGDRSACTSTLSWSSLCFEKILTSDWLIKRKKAC
jgi:hypothetical protein